MPIIYVISLSQLSGLLSSSSNLTVIEFYATSCSRCHAIAPLFEALATQYPNVNFIKCNSGVANDIASAYGVSTIPTFIFLQGSTRICTIRGPDKTGLQNAMRRYASSSTTSTFSGRDHMPEGSPSPATNNPTDTALFRSDTYLPLNVYLGALAVICLIAFAHMALRLAVLA